VAENIVAGLEVAENIVVGLEVAENIVATHLEVFENIAVIHLGVAGNIAVAVGLVEVVRNLVQVQGLEMERGVLQA